jgi:hypothetical protein
MTTKMEIYSLEVGDTIVYLGNFYAYVETLYRSDGQVDVIVSDEEGYRKAISAPDDMHTLWIVCDTDHMENA